MGYEIGAIKYFLGMLTSVWGVMTAFLFGKTLLQPLSYVNAADVILNNLDSPSQMILGLLDVIITGPGDFAKIVIVGLTVMTLSWYIAVK